MSPMQENPCAYQDPAVNPTVTTVGAVVRIPVTALLVAVALLLGIYFYHPYYFGDELFSFNAVPGNDFLPTFEALNAYKPRLLMNLVWAGIVALGLPRWIPMVLVAGSLGACAAFFYHFVRRALGAGHHAALTGAALLLLSRFNVMLYFDYVSGLVEALSLALFLGGLVLMVKPLTQPDACRFTRSTTGGLALWLLVVTVHERYIAAFAVIGAMLLVRALVERGVRGAVRALALASGIALLPIALYVGMVSTLSKTSVLTGTANQEVSVGLETFRVAATYASNVLLGSNFGPSWLAGQLNQLHPWHAALFTVSAILGVTAYAWPWLFKRAAGVDTRNRWPAALLLFSAFAMMLVASLPGADRQEARWMVPVLAMVLMAILAVYRRSGLATVLLFVVASQLFYGVWGGLQTIAQIRASKTADALASTLNTLDPPGETGAMLLAAEPDTSWVLGKDGSEFCRLNLAGTNCLLPKARAAELAGNRIGFGLSSTAVDLLQSPRFKLVGAEIAQLALHPQQTSGGTKLGDGNRWAGWVLGPTAKVTDQGLLVTGMGDNFLKVDAATLRDGMLVYRARSERDQASTFRLQINWHDAEDRFLSAQIEVVDTTSAPANFAALTSPPANAVYGYIYATLHDGAPTAVLIQSVSVMKP